MKILYFTPYFSPQTEAAATRAYWFVKTLKEAGHNVRLLSGEKLRFQLASNKASALKRLIWENFLGIELFLTVFRSSRKLVILSSPPFFTVIWGAFACVLSKKDYILDVRDLYPEVLFETGLIKEQSLAGRILKFLIKKLYLRASKVITVTEGLCHMISDYGVAKPELIMNGFDPELFYPGKLSEKYEKFTLVFHGNLGRVQNIETLLKLATELEKYLEIQILIAGEGLKADQITKAKRKNIEYLGALPLKKISELLRKSHVGLSFRTDDKIGKEAFPVKVFEYFGSGIPTIMTPMGEAGDIIEKLGIGKQFHNDQIDEIVKAILDFKGKRVEVNPEDIKVYSRANQSNLILNAIDQRP